MHNTLKLTIAYIGAEGVPYPNAFAKITEEIAVRLVKRGHTAWVYCRKHFVANDSDYKGIKRIVVPSLNTKHFDTISSSFLSILHIILNKKKIDIVHIHGIGPSIFAFIPRIFGIKTVVHIHALDWKSKKWGKFAKMYLKISEYSSIRFPNSSIVVSNLLRKYCKDKYKKSVMFVPQGIDPPRLKDPMEIFKLGILPKKYILYMGRLVPGKGVHCLLEAFKLINSDLKLVIAGGASHTNKYAQDLMQNKSDKIVFVGHVQGRLKEELLSNAYIFCLPSELEGLSLTVLEAMSYGNCILVSDIPENLKAINEFGSSFKNRDYLDLRDKLQYLIDNPEHHNKDLKEQKEYISKNHNWNNASRFMERIYLSLF